MTDTPLPGEQSRETENTHYNIAAEKILLGTLLIMPETYWRVADFLTPDCFAIPQHGQIYGAYKSLVDRGKVADMVTLRHYFAHDEQLAEIGGLDYLADLCNCVMGPINAAIYGKEIYDHYQKRRLLQAILETKEQIDCSDFGVSPEFIAQSLDRRLADIGIGAGQGSVTTLGDVLHEVTQDLTKKTPPGLPTGLTDLDKLLLGLAPSQLIVIAGRPSMGKSALAATIGLKVARHLLQKPEDGRVAFYSTEMDKYELGARMLVQLSQSRVTLSKVIRKDCDEAEEQALFETVDQSRKIPLFIDERPDLSIAKLKARAMQEHRKSPLSLIIVDYIQLLSGSKAWQGQKVQEISEITRGLKLLAKQLKVPIIALSQLSRQVEQRENKRPMMSDLRDSGSIEQDADVVMLCYRQEYYLQKDEPQQREKESDDAFAGRKAKYYQDLEACAGVTEIILAKQRQGPTGTVKVHFDAEIARFGDRANVQHDMDIDRYG